MDMFTSIEIADMRNTIAEIQRVLCTVPFRAEEARRIICEVDRKHPENAHVYRLLFPSTPVQGVPVVLASDAQLQGELRWKQYYLAAKIAGKTLDEMRKEMEGV